MAEAAAAAAGGVGGVGGVGVGGVGGVGVVAAASACGGPSNLPILSTACCVTGITFIVAVQPTTYTMMETMVNKMVLGWGE